MKKRNLLLSIIIGISVVGGTTVCAQDLTIDDISFEIPDEWQEIQNDINDDGSVFIKY